MEHERGAFKVNSPDMLGAVKKRPEIRSFLRLGAFPPPPQRQNVVPQN
jgi:hypothetical protein